MTTKGPTGPYTLQELEGLRSDTNWCGCADWARDCPRCGARLERSDPSPFEPAYLKGDWRCSGCLSYFWVDQMALVRPGTCPQCRLIATIDFLLGGPGAGGA